MATKIVPSVSRTTTVNTHPTCRVSLQPADADSDVPRAIVAVVQFGYTDADGTKSETVSFRIENADGTPSAVSEWSVAQLAAVKAAFGLVLTTARKKAGYV